MKADLRTALRVAMYLNLVLIFVIPEPYLLFVIVVQIGIMAAILFLSRRRRPREPYDRDGAIHPR